MLCDTVWTVIVKRVTSVALRRTTEQNRIGPTFYPSTDLWQVDWSETHGRRVDELTKSHYTEAAARRHVEGLLRMRASGLSIDSVYTEDI